LVTNVSKRFLKDPDTETLEIEDTICASRQSRATIEKADGSQHQEKEQHLY